MDKLLVNLSDLQVNSINRVISSKLKKKLDFSDRMFILKELSKVDVKYIKHLGKKKYFNLVIDKIINKIKEYKSVYEVDDTKSLLKKLQQDIDNDSGGSDGRDNEYKNIDIINIFGLDSYHKIRELFNPQAHVRNQYIILDSNQGIVDSSTKKIKWDYNHDGRFENNSTTVMLNAENIIGVKISSFITINTTDSPLEYALGGDMNVLIDEFSNQSFILKNNRRCHFIFEEMRYNSADHIYLPRNNGEYMFATPFKSIKSITLSFAHNTNVIDFPSTVDPIYIQLELYYIKSEV